MEKTPLIIWLKEQMDSYSQNGKTACNAVLVTDAIFQYVFGHASEPQQISEEATS